MTEESTDTAVSQAEQHRAGRMENAKEKKGRNIVLLQKVGDDEIARSLQGVQLYAEIASENEGLRATPDVFQYMEDHEMLGTVYGVRFSCYDKDGAKRGYTRQQQTTIKNV